MVDDEGSGQWAMKVGRTSGRLLDKRISNG